jgi:hypothetical protein
MRWTNVYAGSEAPSTVRRLARIGRNMPDFSIPRYHSVTKNGPRRRSAMLQCPPAGSQRPMLAGQQRSSIWGE